MGLSNAPFIIADIGSNHRGSLEIAIRQIEASAGCGVSAAKFQLFSEVELYGFGESTSMLPLAWLPDLRRACDENKIEFMCTAFSPAGVEAIDPYVRTHKVASSDLKYLQLLEAIKDTGKEWIISTGGAHLDEIKTVCAMYNPTAVLECVAAYPARAEDHCLSWLKQIGPKRAFGLSDHSMNPQLSALMVGLGATVFEYHFDALALDDRSPTTPDSPVSLRPGQLLNVCQSLKMWVHMLHEPPKVGGRQCELDMLLKWRRRLIATRDINEGEKLIYGDNFGSYRSKEADTKALGPEFWQIMDGTLSKRAVKQGGAIY